jgi:hypothetical protein
MKRPLFLAVALLTAAAMAEDPYIESLGTSGISTGYRMKGGISRVEVDFALTDLNAYSTRIFGDTSAEKLVATMFYYTSAAYGGAYTFRINAAGKAHDCQWIDTAGNPTKAIDLSRHVLVVDLVNGKCHVKTGSSDESKNFTSYSTYASDFAGLVATLPLSLFANYANSHATAFGNSSKAKIYGVKIYENDTLVHDFVPCLKDGETPCFKDLVGGGFIIGENVAAFRAGGDNVPTYQDNAYVSTAANANGGKLYIDTGYVIGDNTSVALDCAMEGDLMGGSYVTTTLWYLFDGTPSSGKRFQFNFGALAHVGCLRWSAAGNDFYVTTNWWRAAFPAATAANDFRKLRRTYILGGDGSNVRAAVATCGFTNCTVTAAASTAYSGSTTLKIAAYCSGTSYNVPLRIYGCKIYESGVLARDFVPYVGYDYATGTAIPGLRETGTGAFAPVLGGSGDNVPGYGGEIEGEQDAYIESNGADGSGMSTGYRMKGAISRVEVDFRLVTAAAQKYIYGSGVDSTLQTFLYTTGSGVGDSFKFCQRPYSNNGCDRQWVMTPDTKRHTAVTDMANRTNILTGVSIAPKSAFASDFSGKTATLPLTIFGKYSSTAATAIYACPNARIYSVRFYENYVEGGDNTPVRELIPYKKGDVVGFYDTVTGEIVKNDNAAAGAFTFGGAGTDHGALNCYLTPGYGTTVTKGASQTTSLTAYAPGAVSYRWYRDGQLVDDDNDGNADGADGVLPVKWVRGGVRTDTGFLHTYQAKAVFNLYGVTREGEPTAEAQVTSLYLGTTLILR